MRPLKLVMNAFGPYKGKVEIDFTQLAQSSLFLVSGPTGAGKTTIFDAIAYALFDSASGDSRQKDTFKSQFAKDTDLCYVELEFELGEKSYFIRREPTQIGPGSRSKTKQIQSNVELHKDGKVTTKVKEANDEIQEILGLTYDQFRQIVMLPQGSFKKMLESNSGDKEIIFRNIFQTKQIEQFQEKLKTRTKILEDQRKSHTQAIKQAFSSIAIEDNEVLEKAIEQYDVEKTLAVLEESIDKEEKELSAVKEKISHYQNELKLHEQVIGWLEQQEKYTNEKNELNTREDTIKQKESAVQKHTEAQKIVEAKTTVDETEQQIQNKTTQLEELREKQAELIEKEKTESAKLEAVKEELNQLALVRTEITKLNDEWKVFDQVEEKEQLIKQQEEIIQEKQETCETLKEALEEVGKTTEKTETDLKLIADLKIKLEDLKETISTSKETLQQLSNRNEELNRICALQKEEVELNKTYIEVKAAKEKAYHELVKGKAAYYSNLASVLAKELVEGEPCAVCGSVHHPAKATGGKESLTKEELEALELAEKETNTRFTQVSAKLENLTIDIQSRSARLEIDPSETGAAFNKGVAEEQELQNQLQVFKKELETGEKQAGEEADLKRKLEELRKEESRIRTDLQKCESTIDFATVRKQELTEEQVKLKGQLNAQSKQAIQQAIKEKEQYIQTTETTHKTLQNSMSILKSELASTKTAIELTESQLVETTAKKEQLIKKFKQLKETSQLGEAFAEYLLEEVEKETFVKEIEEYRTAVLVNQDRIKQIEENLKTVGPIKEKSVYEAEIIQIKTQASECETQRDKLLTSSSQNKRATEAIQDYQKQSSQVEKEYQLYGALSTLANGSKETDYISFERYVLGIYFEEILIAANQRFSQMTNHRYELQRQLEKGKGSGKQGLDMEVFDHYTGKTRSVHTLSGGETFKASLALALGLSDVIQNQNGGVSVDTLFVDEGFGTLDSDSLDMAVQTLLDLHQKGRLVGIISHVDELKTRIPAHIIVEKTATGSTAYIQK
ncbi:exonuclease SbcC [Marinilactibacillus piezotolerans]|uniref:Nuclease SbcCD subunit C n=1 Tax=Marinilactibacillus piezotolerans TaxID=258723 RepID=A0A1I3VKZ8_9LACT|nr:SMC family ATPase [Marinilactibacillus piezotolerans]SFJ94996.1 exonuclease SbcC [Marinilactibacillus piezotolerans]